MKNDGYDWICAEVIDGAIEIWYLKIFLTCASKYLLDVGSIPLACFIELSLLRKNRSTCNISIYILVICTYSKTPGG